MIDEEPDDEPGEPGEPGQVKVPSLEKPPAGAQA